MKTKSNIFGIVSVLCTLLTIAASLLLLGTGFNLSLGDTTRAYDFIFENYAVQATSNGGMVTGFVFILVAFVLEAFANIFAFGNGSHKFSGFMHLVSGLLLIATAVIFMLAKQIIGNYLDGVTLTLGWGFISSAACAGVAGILGVILGVKSFSSKAA